MIGRSALLFSILSLLALSACQPPAAKSIPLGSEAAPAPTARSSPPEAARTLSQVSTIPESVLRLVEEHGTNLRRLVGMDDDGDEAPAAGVTFDVKKERAMAAVRTLQKQVGTAYFVFISEQNFGLQGQPDQVSLLRTSDPYEAMRVMGTNGINHGIDPEQVITRLKKWDAAFGLSFHGIGFDWVEAEFEQKPPDMLVFAREVYEFCPDVVEQGTQTVERLAQEMASWNKLYLWWD